MGALFLPGRRPGRQRGRTRRGRARLALAPAVGLAQLQVDLGRAFKRRHGRNRWCNLQSKAVGSQHRRRHLFPLCGQHQQRRAGGTRWTPGALRSQRPRFRNLKVLNCNGHKSQIGTPLFWRLRLLPPLVPLQLLRPLLLCLCHLQLRSLHKHMDLQLLLVPWRQLHVRLQNNGWCLRNNCSRWKNSAPRYRSIDCVTPPRRPPPR